MPPKENIPELRVPIREFAESMRLTPTRHELALYNALLAAFKPYRATIQPQEPIGPYIADFFIAPSNLVIEVDGGSHRNPKAKEHDRRRDSFMRNQGITVFRFQNRQVNRNPQAVATFILNKCLPLPESRDEVKVTICPPGSALHKRGKINKQLFWRI